MALPWVNDYSGNIQNLAEYENGAYTWNMDTTGLSWQPYLLYITKKICEDRGYKYDFSKWEESEEYKYLLISDTLPYAWYTPDFDRVLPHWTVAEFFEKLELFLGGVLTIDHRAKTIDFAFTEAIIRALPLVRWDCIVNEHTVEVTVEDDKCEYHGNKKPCL